MTPADCLDAIIQPMMTWLALPFQSEEASVLLLAIALQESGLKTRMQKGGPARGLWQFESEAVADFVDRGVPALRTAVNRLGFVVSDDIYRLLFTNDQLACILARDRLYRLIHDPLPAIEDAATGWAQYVRAWGPGAPRPADWAANHAAAVAALTAA